MPNPIVIPIFWGSAYAENLSTQSNLTQMFKDLVTGPFMNGLAQYGVYGATMVSPIIINDTNPPASITYTDSKGALVDDITKKLISWIQAGTVPAPKSLSDPNTLYMILPPTESTILINLGPSDPIGNGAQGFHNEGVTDPPDGVEGPTAGGTSQTYYWGIVKTNDAGDPSTLAFVNGVSKTSCHELVEQCADINGSWGEVGDPCNNDLVTYRGWTVQPYWSDWSNGCENGDAPVSVLSFLKSIGFNTKKGLSSLGTKVIDIAYIAKTMQSQPAPASPPA
jgi:hypothetical protein